MINLVDVYYDLKIGIKNLWRWFPVIWKDRDHDHYFLFKLIKVKLEFMSNSQESRQLHEDCDNVIKWMRICTKLIQKIQDGNYGVEYQEYINYGDGIFNILYEDLDLYFDKYKGEFKSVTQEYPHLDLNKTGDRMFIALLIGDKLEQKCQRLLFDILNWKIKHFWD